jgi:hypothetical protein
VFLKSSVTSYFIVSNWNILFDYNFKLKIILTKF